jgi:hypothetical protein
MAEVQARCRSGNSVVGLDHLQRETVKRNGAYSVADYRQAIEH